jgi:hypothetical protein
VIAVDPQVKTIDGKFYDVLFIGTGIYSVFINVMQIHILYIYIYILAELLCFAQYSLYRGIIFNGLVPYTIYSLV